MDGWIDALMTIPGGCIKSGLLEGTGVPREIRHAYEESIETPLQNAFNPICNNI